MNEKDKKNSCKRVFYIVFMIHYFQLSIYRSL